MGKLAVLSEGPIVFSPVGLKGGVGTQRFFSQWGIIFCRSTTKLLQGIGNNTRETLSVWVSP